MKNVNKDILIFRNQITDRSLIIKKIPAITGISKGV